MANSIDDEKRLEEIEQDLRNTTDDLGLRIEHGQLLERMGRYNEALAAYDEALKRDPEQARALYARGQLCFERGYFAAALASWDTLLKLQKADESVYLNKVRTLLMQGRISDANNCLKEAQRNYPRSISLCIQRALEYPYGETEKFVACELALFLCEQMSSQPSRAILCNKGRGLSYLYRFSEARTAFEQAIEIDASDPETYQFFAQMLQRADQEAEAQEAFAQALDLSEQRASEYPHRAFDLVSKGDLLRSLQRFQEALTSYERALQLDTASARACFGRGEALFYLQRYAEATAAYQQTVQLSPAYKRVTAAFGSSVDSWLFNEQRLTDCELRLASEPTSAALLSEKAAHLVKLKRYAEAWQISELAISTDAASGQAHLEHGRALYNLGRYEEAYQALRQAYQLGIVPSYNLDGYNLSSVLYFLKKLLQQNARLQRQPEDWKCALEKAEELWRFGRRKDAREAYLLACLAGQNSLDACLEIAKHSYYDEAEALRLLAYAQQFDASNYHVYEQQADLLCHLGRYSEALAASARALQLEPEKSWLAQGTKQRIEAMREESKRAYGNLQNTQSEYLRQGGIAWNTWRKDHPEAARDFSHLELRKLDLQQANLSRLDLSRSDLSQCNLTGANLYAATLIGTTLDHVCLASANAREIAGHEATLTGADLSGTNLYRATLSHARLDQSFLFLPEQAHTRRVITETAEQVQNITNLCKVDLHAASLSEAFLDGVLLAEADLSDADLRRCLLRYANLRQANLSRANLSGASLAGSDLSGAHLRDASLVNTDLRGANLVGANLQGANLFQALLDGADLSGVDLSQTTSQAIYQGRSNLLPPLFPPEQPMAQPHATAAEMRPGILTAIFHCQAPGCSRIMQIELVAPEIPHEDDQYQAFRAETSKPASIICKYLPGYAQSWHPSGLEYARLELALRQGDATALALLDKSSAPFYCWNCHGCYCYAHMRFKEVWDDYYPHPDYWYGTCPYGHGTFVNH